MALVELEREHVRDDGNWRLLVLDIDREWSCGVRYIIDKPKKLEESICTLSIFSARLYASKLSFSICINNAGYVYRNFDVSIYRNFDVSIYQNFRYDIFCTRRAKRCKEPYDTTRALISQPLYMRLE